MRNMVKRMRRLKHDPLRPVLDLEPNLLDVLQKLHRLL
jgi:hypothetical protein